MNSSTCKLLLYYAGRGNQGQGLAGTALKYYLMIPFFICFYFSSLAETSSIEFQHSTYQKI